MFIVKYKYGFGTKGGTFGDSFGALNALFSGFAFAGIIYTIFLQKQELKLQRKELRQTREEFIIQNETLKKQRFENTFFHLVGLHNEIVDKLSVTRIEHSYLNGVSTTEPVTYNKKEFFNGAIKALGSYEGIKHNSDNMDEVWDGIKNAYKNFNMEYASHLSHYFRNLYHIYKYIHLSNLITKDEKQFYASIIRAQLSDKELALIFYNMLIDDLGYPNFKYLDENYDVLKNLNKEMDLFLQEIHWQAFNFAKINYHELSEDLKPHNPVL